MYKNCMKLIRNMLCLNTGCQADPSEMLQKWLMVLSWNIQRMLKGMLKKQRCYAHTSTNAATTIAIVQSKGIKVKLLRNI